jgi:hypothetical protein
VDGLRKIIKAVDIPADNTTQVSSVITVPVYSGNGCDVKVKVKFTLERAMKAQWESRGIVLLFL